MLSKSVRLVPFGTSTLATAWALKAEGGRSSSAIQAPKAPSFAAFVSAIFIKAIHMMHVVETSTTTRNEFRRPFDCPFMTIRACASSTRPFFHHLARPFDRQSEFGAPSKFRSAKLRSDVLCLLWLFLRMLCGAIPLQQIV